jgi:ABC-type transport system involved in multi-copper enzyme maturation permease subunit
MSSNLLESPALAKADHHGPSLLRLIRAEITKIRTVNAWWLFGLGIVIFTALAFWVNAYGAHLDLHGRGDGDGGGGGGGGGPDDKSTQADIDARRAALAAQAHTATALAKTAANLLTSGQFFGLLLAMVIGILVVTNEFFHQTATATFITSPHRTAVIIAKAVAGALFGAVFWLISTVLSLIATPIFLSTEHVSVSLTQWTVVQSVLLNLLAFALWAIFGMGLGTLIRSQIGSIVTGMALYLLGFAAVLIVFNLLYNAYPHYWVLSLQVISPAVASRIMITPGQVFEHAPHQWVGGVVLGGYALLTGFIGILTLRRRDIS